MYFQDLFLTVMIYLAAGVVAVPLAKRLGLGSVLGYLLAGVVIGPYVLGLVDPSTNETVLHFTEFGVVIMLFLIGMELQPSTLWRMRGPIVGLGGMQVVVSALVLAVVLLVLGYTGRAATALGAILALSSTAIVLSTLAEKDWMRTEGGQASFSVLLFQDIAVIPMIALLPLLADPGLLGSAAGDAGGTNGEKGMSGMAQAAAVIGAVGGIILAGRYAFRPMFRVIAKARQHEIFTASVLLLVIAISMLMTLVGLSPALGAFLAGVVLAESEFRHEIESDIEPFKGLLLGIFFISVGCGIQFSLVASAPVQVLLGVAGLMILKLGVLWLLARFFVRDRRQRPLLYLGLAQGGEFAFVLFSYAKSNGVLGTDVIAIGTVIVAISMLLTPLLFIFYEKKFARRVSAAAEQEPDEVPEDAHGNVLILGFGRFGHVIGRILLSQGFACTVLDHDPEQIRFLSKFGFRVFFGEATRVDLMRTAGAEEAQLIVVAVDDEDAALRIVDNAKKHFPGVPLAVRALSRAHAYTLLDRGVTILRRDTSDSAVELSIACLKQLGYRAFRARRIGRQFAKYDEQTLHDLAHHWGDETYFAKARAHIQALEDILREDRTHFRDETEDTAWSPPGRQPEA